MKHDNPRRPFSTSRPIASRLGAALPALLAVLAVWPASLLAAPQAARQFAAPAAEQVGAQAADPDSEAVAAPSVVRAALAADELLVPWHEAVLSRLGLPSAPPTPELPGPALITRLAFGSCYHQSRADHVWESIGGFDPQAFLFIGDNVYGDTNWNGGADLASLRQAYARLASQRRFRQFRQSVPMLPVWDDHDYGFNDGGADFAFRRAAEMIFEHFWDSPADVRSREGVYFSRLYGPEGKRVQLIVLDTRFFRSALRLPAEGEKGPANGRYLPQTEPGATMLGEAQWSWLEGELSRPADLRILVSSIQVLTTAHGWEAWATMPAERERLMAALRARAGGGVVILSGDRHSGGIYLVNDPESDESLWEITSSSLNLAFSSTQEATAREPDPARLTPFIGEENFGLLEIDWKARSIALELRSDRGELRAREKMAF